MITSVGGKVEFELEEACDDFKTNEERFAWLPLAGFSFRFFEICDL